MRFLDELKSKNFGIYGQWSALISMLLCFALGISNILSFGWFLGFGVFLLVACAAIIIIEIPFLSRHVDGFRHINNYTRRTIFYAILSLVCWLSLIVRASSLIAAAVFLLLTSGWYLLAAIRGQEFMSSSILGGPGVAAAIARAI